MDCSDPRFLGLIFGDDLDLWKPDSRAYVTEYCRSLGWIYFLELPFNVML